MRCCSSGVSRARRAVATPDRLGFGSRPVGLGGAHLGLEDAQALTQCTFGVPAVDAGVGDQERLEGEQQTAQDARSSPEQSPRRQYVNFTFYKIDPAWRRLPEDERTRGKQEFLRAVEEYQGKVLVIAYTTVGIRGDCDLMLWRISYELELFQEMSTKIMASGLGKYIYNPYSYLAITKRSIYVDHHTHENQESKRLTVVPGKAKYIFVYPFVKTREWFLLTKAARQGMMDEHIEVGHRFPSVKLNTTYSFGLDDQEWVVAFESDKPEDFLDLVMALRETEGSRYTLRDTPIFTCIRKSLKETLDTLGG